MLVDFSLLLLLGVVAGLLSGMLGIGGGVVIVPALVFVFGYQGVNPDVVMHCAIGTSLATICVTSLSSIRAHQARGAILWPVFRQITPGVILGGALGAWLAGLLDSGTLKMLFAPFLVLVALQLARGGTCRAHHPLPGGAAMIATGGVIGAVSALFGIGGGALSVPFFTWCNIAVRQAVATSAAVGFPIAVTGVIGFAITGWHLDGRPPMSVGYVSLPATLGIVVSSVLSAPQGARLAHYLPEKVLKRVFAGFLVLMAMKLWFG